MKIKYFFSVLLLSIVQLLQGCAGDLFPGGQPIPQETTSELIILGASLGSMRRSYSGSLPDDIGAAVGSEQPGFVSSGELTIAIVPNEFVQQNISSGIFLYAFSQQIGEEFELLPNPKFSTPGELPERVFVELYNDTSLLDSEPLANVADFILDSDLFFLPFNATHLELRYAASGSPAPIVVERWDLTSFYGYNRYLKPLIDANQ